MAQDAWLRGQVEDDDHSDDHSGPKAAPAT
jgi:hypothetical protein